MRAMHYRVLMLAAWLLFFYNLERVSKFVGAQRIDLLTLYAYVFVALVVLITFALPSLQRLPLPLLASGGVALFLVFKASFGYRLWGEALPVTVTEMCAVLVTGLLTRQVIYAVWEFESSVVNFTIKHIGRQTKEFAIEQGDMYQEVRRARAHNRPLTLMALEPEANSFTVAVEKMVQEVQRATMKQYVLAAMAKILKDMFGPYSIIAQDGGRFLVLLPEVSKESVPRLTTQLRGQLQEAMDLELQIGTASMPDIEIFDGLVEAAYADMNSKTQHKSEEAAKPAVASVPGRLT